MIDYYGLFIEYHENQGRLFPCASDSFYLRALDFAREYVITCEESISDEDLVDLLCCNGIGPGWNDE